MTLNFSPYPIFPAPNPSDGDLFSSFRERGGEGLGKSHRFNWEFDELYDNRRDRVGVGPDSVGSCEPVYNDIVDLLPSDPFGMDLSNTWTAAIAGWIEDLTTDGQYPGDYERDKYGQYHLFAEFKYLYDGAAWFPPEPGPNPVDTTDSMVKWLQEPSVHVSSKDGFVQVLDVKEFASSSGAGEVNLQAEKSWGCTDESCSGGDGGRTPHEGLLFSLSHLGVQDLLSAERVCKTLRSAVLNDPLLWRCIHIDQPLSQSITDDALLRLTERAQGSLQCLILEKCWRITDDGLKRVLDGNKKLTKLSVPGCPRISVEGLVNSLKIFKSRGMQGIKHLRIGGLYGIKQEHFEELKLLLGLDECQQLKARKPRFYHNNTSSSCDDGSAIDIDTCPKCQNAGLVYDCPAESCQGKGSQLCRACMLCITRCVQCGRCINDGEYEETFFLDLLCLGCWKHIPHCQEER